MITFVNLSSTKKGEISNFLSSFYNSNLDLDDTFSWKKDFENPIEICDIIGVYIDNSDRFDLNMFICLDYNIFINITERNGNSIIKYLFERYPY